MVAAHPVDEVAPPDAADRVEASVAVDSAVEAAVVVSQEVDVVAVASVVDVAVEATKPIGSDRSPSHLMRPDGFLSLSQYHSGCHDTYRYHDQRRLGAWKGLFVGFGLVAPYYSRSEQSRCHRF